MTTILIVPVLWLAAVLDTFLAPRWQVHGVAPDLMALVAMVYLSAARSRYAFLVGALAGLVSDLNSTSPLGLAMFAFSLVAYAVLLLKQNFHLDAAIARFVIIGLGAMMVCLMQSAWLRLLGRISLPWQGLVERAVLVGMFTSTVAIPLLIFSWWFHQQRRITPLVDQTATS